MEVEVCVDSLRSARHAEQAGADRIELCAALGVGGITPPASLIRAVKEQASIPVHVLLRPRAGDFYYDAEEFQLILNDIAFCRELGVDGIVCGVLHPSHDIDRERTTALREASHGMSLTFHRAIDWVAEPLRACAFLDHIGVDFILSSGQQPTAEEGFQELLGMQGELERCQLIPAGGIRAVNARRFKEAGFTQLHLSALRGAWVCQPPPFTLNNPAYLVEGMHFHADGGEIKSLVESVK